MATKDARVCVRLEGSPADTRQCTSTADASDTRPGVIEAAQRTRLPVSVGEIIEPGRGLDIEVEVPGQPSIHGRAITLKSPPLLRSALCQGVQYTIGSATIYFYLDDG